MQSHEIRPFRFSVATADADYDVFSLLPQILAETQWESKTGPLQATFGLLNYDLCFKRTKSSFLM